MLLARVGLTQAEISVKVGVSESLVSHWIPGRKVPPLPKRRVLQVLFGIPIESWDQAASTFSIPRPKTSGEALTAREVDALAIDTFRAAKALVEAVYDNDDPASAVKLLRDALRVEKEAAQLAGFPVDGRKVDLHQRWRELENVIFEALRPWPAAAKAVGEALLKSRQSA